MDGYKTRAPAYTMGMRTSLNTDKTVKPGPAAYSLGRVRRPLGSAPLRSPPAGRAGRPRASWGARSRCHVFLLLLFPVQVTLTKPQAPAHTFGLRHSCFTAPLVLDV